MEWNGDANAATHTDRGQRERCEMRLLPELITTHPRFTVLRKTDLSLYSALRTRTGTVMVNPPLDSATTTPSCTINNTMATLKPPSRIEYVGFPIFTISWFGDPGDGLSVVACSGGGGSARTGVKNCIFVTINDNPEPVIINMDTKLGAVLHIYANPITKKVWLLVSVSLGKIALGSEIHRYSLPDCQLNGICKVMESCNALAVNALTDRLALGCEDGTVQVHALEDELFGQGDETVVPPLFVCEMHKDAVCCVAFSPRGDKLLSSAKDGTACLWNQTDGSFLTQVTCLVDIAKEKPAKYAQAKKKAAGPPKIMVRGCAFGDLEGTLFYTVASAKRGKAFLTRWVQDPKNPDTYVCLDRVVCTENPVTSFALSQDGGLLVLGGVDSSVTMWGTAGWKPLKVFQDAHGLPLTCVAPRPYPVRLRGEDDGVEIHARTGSADGTMACLTLQTRVPDSGVSSGGDPWIMRLIHRLILLCLVLWTFAPVFMEARNICDLQHQPVTKVCQCLLEEVLLAPAWRPGVVTPPY
jgi:WD40 repeat protein